MPDDEVEADLSFDLIEPSHKRATMKGVCPTCDQEILVRNGSGRLWHHGPNNKYRCRGSGALPREGTLQPRGNRVSRN